MKEKKTIVLAGNPNVGKSTIFNQLTGRNQHTGNWTGKTVEISEGICETEHGIFRIIDLPGTYSLYSRSPEEEIARNYLMGEDFDSVMVICDGTCLERNLNLVFQVMEICPSVMVCINLMDEAEKKGIRIQLEKLEELLDVPVIGISAHSRSSVEKCRQFLETAGKQKKCLIPAKDIRTRMKEAEAVCRQVVSAQPYPDQRDRKLDRIFTSRKTGFPVMFLLVVFILWMTIFGANGFSDFLLTVNFWAGEKLKIILEQMDLPRWFCGLTADGIFRVTGWVVSVMLPPMLIFFPLFSLLEDFGYLPRAAYNMDRPLECCKACGKQALTMCMGLGCNAAGITGCRIIDSPRERIIAVLTNVFMPCNGRFPTILMEISIFFTSGAVWKSSLISAVCLTALIIFAAALTLLVSRILSEILLKGVPSFFVLELPPYRKPQIGKVILHSVRDRVLFVLMRAVMAAAPAGALIWILANVKENGSSLLAVCTEFFEPLGQVMGLDGVIFTAFLLGFPANEIVMPIIIMAYLAQGAIGNVTGLEEIREILLSNGWNLQTAVSFLIFSIAHWPCAASAAAVRRETGKISWMILSCLLPAVTGFVLCSLINILLEII